MERYTRNGLTFDVRDSGPSDGEPVVLLHGFPQDGSAFDRVVPGLVGAGYRTLVPDQRGYSPGARPHGRVAYRLSECVADVLALLDAAGIERAHVVGHDWGGFVGWALGARHRDRLRTLSVLSVPHPAAFSRSLLSSDQALRSWYMGFFQLPLLPERVQLAAGGAVLRRTLTASGLPAADAERYVARMREPGALRGALGWYRAIPLAGRTPVGRVQLPTLYVWSDGDVALTRTAAEATGRYVSGPYRFEVLAGVSHWIPETAPRELTDLLLEHLGSVVRG